MAVDESRLVKSVAVLILMLKRTSKVLCEFRIL